ncbi:hypothetical protein N7541_009161 [Penicillium brevicompactum]|uniref:Uncharacterized protein n=1 Tax=Penicillium brevicompactum TaxID=5074 RepID=A0A9W9QXG6_PENBR|nr:hypothetical protein N7541_009161 [Penicillium brevicompactum]
MNFELKTFNSTARCLSTLPTELAHQIIDDLRVKDVLKLLIYDHDRVSALVVSHPVCRVMFNLTSDQNIAKVQFASQLYHDIFREVHPALSADGWLRHAWLPLNIHCVNLRDRDLIMSEMRDHIHCELYLQWRKADLTRHGAPEYRDLDEQRAPPPYNKWDFEAMRERWEAIKTAKASLFGKMSAELDWAADILKSNPDILKRTLDPHQLRRSNTNHITSRMQNDAGKILRASGQKFVVCEHFKYAFFEVIPFDFALVELLGLMEKHGLVTGDQLRIDGTPSSDIDVSHPSSIRESAQALVNGMAHFDVSPELNTEMRKTLREMANNFGTENSEGILVPRTGNTPWSGEEALVDGVDMEGPFFTPGKTMPTNKFIRPGRSRWDPHGEGERKWLEAFVNLYRYLKGL